MSNADVPVKQRALIFQGSVALGAFEAGVFKKLYDMIKQKDENWKKRMFDIVAGTSAGAINAAILTSHVKQKKTWEGSAEKIVQYWREHLSSPTPTIIKQGVYLWDENYQWWGKYYDTVTTGSSDNRTVASEEAARRYFSTKYFFTNGVPNVFSPSLPFPELDSKFFDNNPLFPPTNLWLRYNNKPLRESLIRVDGNGDEFVKFPLTTSFENGEPRFLAVSVDVQHGKAVTFDSYSKSSTFRAYDPQTSDYKEHIVNYDKGIMPEHVMASASFPVYFDYELVDGRNFWDGGILSNTPLREVLQAHRDYWYKGEHEQNKEMKVPDLDVYIVNVWPSVEITVPTDRDGVIERKNDITHSDQTEYDQKVALIIGDYIDLFNETKELAIRHISDPNKRTDFLSNIERLLNGNTKYDHKNKLIAKKPRSKKRSGKGRTYGDLIYGRFKLNKVVTIEHKDDPDSISNKWADYTEETIDKLITDGQDFDKKAIVRITPAAEELI
jgi:predicted acylesterase/phospholipase RssA